MKTEVKLPSPNKHTVDGQNPAPVDMVKNPTIYRVSAPSQGGWEWDFVHQPQPLEPRFDAFGKDCERPVGTVGTSRYPGKLTAKGSENWCFWKMIVSFLGLGRLLSGGELLVSGRVYEFPICWSKNRLHLHRSMYPGFRKEASTSHIQFWIHEILQVSNFYFGNCSLLYWGETSLNMEWLEPSTS